MQRETLMKSITLKDIETGIKTKIKVVIVPSVEFKSNFEPNIIQKRKWVFDDTGEDLPIEMQELLLKPKLFELVGKNQLICKIE
jgi:hypothetical protein